MSDQSVKPQTIEIQQKKRKITLKEFINNNYHLFTAIGVIGGLAALFTRLENAQYLAFISFVLLILLDWELWTAFPKSEEASVTLKIFEMFSQIFLFATGMYLYSAYQTIVIQFLPVILIGIFSGVFVLLSPKTKLFVYIRKIAPEEKWYASVVRGFVACAIIASILALAMVVAHYISILLK